MEHYWDCSLCIIENKGQAFRCRTCSGKLRGRERLLHELGESLNTRKRAAVLSLFAVGLGQIYSRRLATGLVFAVLIPLVIGLVWATWGGFTYGHGFLVAAAAFVLGVALVDAWVGPTSRIAPCKQECPARLDIPDYLQLILDGEWEQGYSLIRTRIPFVGVIGRICPHPCEARCVRGIDGEPISINGCKRFLGDRHRQSARAGVGQVTKVARLERGGEGVHVGVIGAGPAGAACAYYLRVLQVGVTVYDAHSSPGGRLGSTIPDYRLPPRILEEEVEGLTELGVAFRLKTLVGPGGLPMEALAREHGVVFLGVGAQTSVKLSVPGAEAFLDFQEVLRSAKKGLTVDIGRSVAVIGGGNAAIDVCRTALRLGAEEVHLLYRRARKEMPARQEEVEEAIREGVQLHFLADPTMAKVENGRIRQLQVRRMAPGPPDASGRPSPTAIPGGEWTLAVDCVIPVLGQKVGGGVLDDPYLALLRREPDGRVWVDPATQRTSLDRVYAGGDVVSGAATAVEAMAQGRKAALALYTEFFRREIPNTRLTDRLMRKPFKGHVETPQAKMREEMPTTSPRARKESFREVNEGFKDPAAMRESGRCLQCHREL